MKMNLPEIKLPTNPPGKAAFRDQRLLELGDANDLLERAKNLYKLHREFLLTCLELRKMCLASAEDSAIQEQMRNVVCSSTGMIIARCALKYKYNAVAVHLKQHDLQRSKQPQPPEETLEVKQTRVIWEEVSFWLKLYGDF